MPPSKPPSKKQKVLSDIFTYCEKRGDYTFDNTLVKKISAKHQFKNPFDATKTDNFSLLPNNMQKKGYCVVHLGEGQHRFVQAAKHFFHPFEKIEEKEEIQWPYRKSALNETDSSESNILFVGFNQKIMHDFLYKDIVANPKIYGSRRTKLSFSYMLGNEKIIANKLQMEMDLITEYQGIVTVFEGKNKFSDNFAVPQLYHPFRYFHQLNENKKISINEINCCYLLRKTLGGDSVIRLYLYNFTNPNKMSSIRLKKCGQYRLMKR